MDDGWLIGTATLVGLVPFIGPLVYLLFRPPETLAEVRAREIEVRALETRLLQRPQPRCPVCRSDVAPDYLVCPICTTTLREPCVSCKAPPPVLSVPPTRPAAPRGPLLSLKAPVGAALAGLPVLRAPGGGEGRAGLARSRRGAPRRGGRDPAGGQAPPAPGRRVVAQ